MENVTTVHAWAVFVILLLVALFFLYVLYFRGLLIERKIIIFCGEDNCKKFPGCLDLELSPYMKHEAGTITLVAQGVSDRFLIYQFWIAGQLNIIRFFVHVTPAGDMPDGIYGKGHIERESKACKLYGNHSSLADAGGKVFYVAGEVEAVEVFQATAFVYYRLNNFWGCSTDISILKRKFNN